MSDSSVDSIILDIQSSIDDADAGLKDLASALKNICNASKNVKVDNLIALKNAINGFRITDSAANSINTFATAIGALNKVADNLSFKKPTDSVEAFARVSRESAQEIGSVYGMPAKEIKKLQEMMFEFGRTANANNGIATNNDMFTAMANHIWDTRNVVNTFAKEYESIVDKIKVANKRAGSVKLDFGVKEIGDDYKSLRATLGKGFTTTQKQFDTQQGFDAWMQQFDTGEMSHINAMIEKQGGIIGDTSSQFRALAAIVQEYNAATKKGAVEANEFNSSLEGVYNHILEVYEKFFDLSKALGEVNFDSVTRNSETFIDAFKRVIDTVNGLTIKPQTGTALKDMGEGMKSISSAMSKIKDVESEKITLIADSMSKVGASIGNLGSNNNISIKVSAKGLETVKQTVGDAAESLSKLGAEQKKIEEETGNLSSAIAVVNTDFSNGGKSALDYANAIEVLQKALKDAGKGKTPVSPEQYDAIQKKLVSLKKASSDFKKELEKGTRTTGLDKTSQKIQQIIDRERELKQIISDMDSGKTGFDWKQYKNAAAELQKLNEELSRYKKQAQSMDIQGLKNLSGNLKSIASGFNSVANVGTKVVKGILKPFSLIGSAISKEVQTVKSRMSDMVKSVSGSLNKLSAFWKRTMRTFTFMLVRKAITAVIGDVKTAVDSLAVWSKNMGTPFNDSISSIVADFKYMARSILAAVEPLINAVAPIIERLADLFSNLATKIASLFAALTGQNYVMKAKKNVKDYAASVDKATKAAKNGLQSFDELNNITTQKGSKDNPIEGWKDEWEKMPLDDKMKDLADKIKAIAKDLWYPIGKAWDAMKDYVLGGWKYMTDEMGKLLKDVWRDFIEVWKQDATVDIFKNIFGMVGDIEYGIGHLAKNFRAAWNDASTGKHILENIRDIVGILVQHARNVTLYFRDWARGVSFRKLLKSVEKLTNSLKGLADFIGGVFEDAMIDGVFKFIEWFIEEGLPNINNAIANVLDTFNFDKIRDDIRTVIIAVEQLLEHLVGGITKAGEGLGKKIAEWFNSDKFTKFTEAIARILNVFTEDRIATVLEGIGTAFLNIASALADIVSSESTIKVFEAIGQLIDKKGVDGIAKDVEMLVAAIVGLKGGAIVITGIAKACDLLAKAAPGLALAGKGLLVVGSAVAGFKGGNLLYEFITGEKINMSAWEQFKTIIESFSDGSWKDAMGLWFEDIMAGLSELEKMIRSVAQEWTLAFSGLKWPKEMLSGNNPFEKISEQPLLRAVDPLQITKGLSDALNGQNPFQGFIDQLTQAKNAISTFITDTNGALKLWGQDVKEGFLAIADAEAQAVSPTIEKVKTKFAEMKTSALALKEDLKGAWDLMAQDISTWFNEQVTPWFTLEKWVELATGIKTGIKTVWDETVAQWIADITTWWESDVAPWFTQAKWTEALSGIAPAFKEAFKGAANAGIEALNKLLEGLEKMINTALGADGLGKLGEWATKLGIEVDLSFSPITLPRIPKFEHGGFPEDGIFSANHNELVGQFSNGKTAVANNSQIVDGISSGVERANDQQNQLFNQMIDLLGVIADKDLTIGDDMVYSSYQRGAARYTKRYGV